MTQKESSILLTALTAVQELIEMEARKVNFGTHNKSEMLYIRGLNKGLDIAIQKINAAKIAVCENKI